MLQRARALMGLARGRQVEVEGLRLQVPPGVLDPVLFRSGAWFAAQVARQVQPGMRLLDMGTGSGIVGLLAQKAGARVTAVDLEPRCVEAARTNGLADVRQGDLFAPVQGETFDLIAFNPPYYLGQPKGPTARHRALDGALYGGEDWQTLRRFGAELGPHLAPGGRALLCWSDRATEAPRKILGPDWELQRSAVVEAELLSLWDRLAPGQRRPPKSARPL